MMYRYANDPDDNTAKWGSEYDNANQSACGIPANAFVPSQASIHPYWLKYAGLDRMASIPCVYWLPEC